MKEFNIMGSSKIVVKNIEDFDVLLKNVESNIVIIKFNNSEIFLKLIQENKFPPLTKIRFINSVLLDDYDYDNLALALKSNTNIVELDYSEFLGGFNSQETIRHCLKRNELIHKYPNLRKDILDISLAQKLYIATTPFSQSAPKNTGLFVSAARQKLEELRPQLDTQQMQEIEKMHWYGS